MIGHRTPQSADVAAMLLLCSIDMPNHDERREKERCVRNPDNLAKPMADSAF